MARVATGNPRRSLRQARCLLHLKSPREGRQGGGKLPLRPQPRKDEGQRVVRRPIHPVGRRCRHVLLHQVGHAAVAVEDKVDAVAVGVEIGPLHAV